MGIAQHSKMYKQANSGGEHPPGIELHLSNRFFAVTEQRLDWTPDRLVTVPTENLIWILKEAGPSVARKSSAGEDNAYSTHGDRFQTNGDNSRSGAAFKLAGQIKRGGGTYEDFLVALRADPVLAGWLREKGETLNYREAKRAWENAAGTNAHEQAREQQQEEQARKVVASPFVWADPATIPRRQWLYGRHLIRAYTSATISPGGFGKSSLVIAETLAMVTGRALLGDQPAGQLRVWQINLEDPEDELRRRFAAAAIHYGIGPEDIGNRLFLDSGRKVDIVIAREGRDGVEIAVPIIEAIKAEIIDKQIDALVIDPFVACHEVAENDNTRIAAVVRQWAMVAETTNCAIELVHHARKPANGQHGKFTVDDARGASALIFATRSARVLNIMSKDEAEKADIASPSSYFSVSNGKANLAPRNDKATWRHIVGVALGNGDSTFDQDGDYVGVVEPWQWPDPFAEVDLEQAKEVQQKIAKGEWRADQRSETWAGIAVAEVLGFDMSNKAAKDGIRGLIAGWLATGALREVKRRDINRHERKFIEVGQWLT
jgi:hypothetical protein